MALAIEGRVRAIGHVGFAAAGVPAWVGDHPGFNDAIVDGGAGIFTVTLDGCNTPGAQLCAFVTAVGDLGVANKGVAPTNSRDIVVRTRNWVGGAIDDVAVQVMAIEIPAQA